MKTQYEISSGDQIVVANHYISSASKAHGLVIFLTGDSPSGSKGKLWQLLVDEFSKDEIDTITFDFHSQGLSSGDRSELSLTLAIQNFCDVMSFFEKNSILSGYKKISAVAASFGASVLLATQSLINLWSSVVFKSPASDLPDAYINDIGQVENEKWKASGYSEENGLNYTAYTDSQRYDLFHCAEKLISPTLIIQGSEDEIVLYENTYRLQKIMSNAELFLIPGGKHDYKQEGATEAFVSKCVEYIRNDFVRD